MILNRKPKRLDYQRVVKNILKRRQKLPQQQQGMLLMQGWTAPHLGSTDRADRAIEQKS
jgi:hypothetical protein